MKSELLNKACAAALDIYAGVGELCWQGDFGKGISTGSGVFSEPGANPCLLYSATAATGSAGSGLINPQFRLGMVIGGDNGAEFIFCKLVLGSTTDLLPGQVYQWDENFLLTLLTTSGGTINAEMGVLNVWAPATAAGSYYCWLQRAGHAAIQAAATSAQTAQAESTTTAGQVLFKASHTVGSKSTDGITAFGGSSSITFTGTTTNGSPYITAVASQVSGGGGNIADLTLGMVITGTNLPANAIIAGIDKVGGVWRILIGTNTGGSYNVTQNATGTASGTLFTVTSHVVANVFWPQLKTQN